MTKAAEQLLQQVMELDPNDRIELAGRVLDEEDLAPVSEDPQYAAEWETEIQRRLKDFESGKEKGIPWRKAMADIRSGAIDDD